MSGGVLRDEAQQEVVMTTFDAREKAFEDKFVHDSNRSFQALARRNRLTGEWAVEKLGLSGEKAEDYVKTVCRLQLADGKSDQIFLKVKSDFAEHHVEISDEDIIKTMSDYLKPIA